IFLRRLHGFAVSMKWLPWPILMPRQWPRIRFKPRRGVTCEEHQKLLARESDAERRAFLELLWHIGAAQIDLVSLTADNVDWSNRTISYVRRKTGRRPFSGSGKWSLLFCGGYLPAVRCFPTGRSSVPPTARTVSIPDASVLGSPGSAFIPTDTLGRNARRRPATPNATRKPPLDTAVRQFIEPTRRRPASSCRRWRSMKNNR